MATSIRWTTLALTRLQSLFRASESLTSAMTMLYLRRVLATRAESTKIVDLKGMTVLPGLIDSHGHVRNFGRLQEMVHECGSLGFIWGIVQ